MIREPAEIRVSSSSNDEEAPPIRFSIGPGTVRLGGIMPSDLNTGTTVRITAGTEPLSFPQSEGFDLSPPDAKRCE